MDDEYRTFLESAWNWSSTSEVPADSDAALDASVSPEECTAGLIDEVVEIEADDEDFDGEVEASSNLGDPSAAQSMGEEALSVEAAIGSTEGQFGEISINKFIDAGEVKPVLKPFANGKREDIGTIKTPRAKQLGASTRIKPVKPLSEITSSELMSSFLAHPPSGKVGLETFLGTWTDSMGNNIRVEWARTTANEEADCTPSQLDVELLLKGGDQAPIHIKVIRDRAGNFRCGHFSLDVDRSYSDCIVWADGRGRGKTAVWVREGPAAAVSVPCAARGPKPASRAGNVAATTDAVLASAPAATRPASTATAPTAAPAAAGAMGATSMPPVAGATGTSLAQNVDSAAPAASAAPSSRVGSLGARAKVKAARPPCPTNKGHTGVEAHGDAAGPAGAISLATFLGAWVDSMGHAVEVAWARPTNGNHNPNCQLDVRLVKPRSGRQPIQLKITKQESGLFNCGHYNLNVTNSHPAKIVWADKFNPAKLSIWLRENRVPAITAATPNNRSAGPGCSVPAGVLKRSQADSSTASAGSKLPRTSSDPLVDRGQVRHGVTPVQMHGAANTAVSSTLVPQAPQAPAASLRSVPPDAKDAEGRPYNLQSVVVNFVDVGMSYAKSVLAKNPNHGNHDFDWEGVRRCVRYMRAEREMQIFGVVPEDFQAQDSGSGHRGSLPFDIQLMCECVEEALAAPHSGEAGAAREMTIERAYERNCLYVDSGSGAAPLACHAACRTWLEKCRDLLHLRYFFDSVLGTFDVFDGNVGTPTLARMNSFS